MLTVILNKHFHTLMIFVPVIFLIIGISTAEAARERVKGRGHTAHRPHPCEQSSCYPATGNLLVGREKQLWASSTCGLNGQVRYCIVSHLEDRKKCFWCDSRPQNANNPLLSHRIENIVYKYFPGTEKRSWWQSENGVENVTIQLDLEAEFHFTHLIITFKTFRPAAMLIERSYDFGATWQVYRYFAYNCDESFPGVPKISPRSLTDVVCESRYSNVAPSTDGEIIFRVLPPNLPINDPYSQEVQNLLKMTNLRINFTKLHTLGDDLLDYTQEIQEKYYYAVNHMIVRGSCSCYGHASRCLPLPNVEPRPDMVHGRCECTHNTKGLNCEVCEDFYSDLPWKPAIGKLVNACKKCNCNNHATSCHFDAAIYEASGRVSGGVCDGCLHNTVGQNCEQCKPFYYQVPSMDINDPDVCQPCECDTRGSLDDGICDSRTDLANGLEAGRCHCKENVEARRCNRCKNGFWNFDENNPYGCEPCTCNTLGTVDNQGCNTYTGECTCKPFVTGRNCNQCQQDYWGLSNDIEGCKPCDCDPGGAIDNSCDVITGQCRCRAHVAGRTCSQPDQSYFTGALDFLVYEAELAGSSENSHVVIREPFRDNTETSWTGTGFMQMAENSDLEFVVDNIQTSMQYDIVIRYEPQLPGTWKDIEITVERPGPVDQDGPCANSIPDDDIKHVSLPEGSRSVPVYPPVCLEAGRSYKIHLNFKSYDDQVETPSASVLIDSIALIPRIESIPFFHDLPMNEFRRQEYEHYRCGQAFYEVLKPATQDVCKKYHYSIGFYVNGGAFSCQCDPTGSLSSLCDSLGGACQCKKNVVGRTCERCAPGTYGFGPEGCKACDCNPTGALDNFCDVITGQCKCHRNRYGRECDKCQPGFWNYPNCQRCTCNGHADVCDSRTGSCTNCRDSTSGHYCERCIEGYYGDPSIDGDIPCRPCPCPGTVESNHSYATRCSLDARTQDVVCECSIGYAGSRCDICADNYYGNPDVPGGSCQPCNCNNNIDISRPGNCDVRTGKCLQCLFNTEGPNCEVCKANYYGVAVNQSCRECVCDLLGTDKNSGPCNRETGQCPCLPNVIGLSCDECAENHWKIASGTGCEPCNCDSVGSYDNQCNLYEGQCDCKPGFGGRQCNQCQANYWGNPTVECYECGCNLEGSKTLQCHRENGSCLCLTGIGGEKCSECARGYLGTSPSCSPCGECFDNWDRILNELKDQTVRVVQAASEIKQTGVTGAYTQSFEALEKKLNEVDDLLKNTTVSTQDLVNIEQVVEKLRFDLNESKEALDSVENKLQNITQQIYLTNLALSDLENKSELLRNKAKTLKNEATKLQEANVEGALNLTRESQKMSQKAQKVVENIEEQLQEAERNYKRTEARINRTAGQFQKEHEGNDNALDIIEKKLKQLEQEIPDLNEKICDKRGDPCDQLCGGAGCGSCGGLLSCEHGAVTKASTTVGLGKDAKEAISKKEALAEELLRGISLAKQETTAAYDLAKAANNEAQLARNRSEDMIQETGDLSTRLSDFLNAEKAKPADIRNLAEEVTRKHINLKPEKISELAEKINLRISSLKDIDAILAQTADNLTVANSLKAKADMAKNNAEGILNTTHQVVIALDEAKGAQDKADQAVLKAKGDIETARRDLTSIGSETDEAETKTNKTLADVTFLTEKLKQLQTSVLINERAANEVADAAGKIKIKAQQAQVNASKLNNDYVSTSNALSNRAALTREAHTRARNLRERASQFSIGTSAKWKELTDMNMDYVNNEQKLNMLTSEIESLIKRMNQYLGKINTQSEYYRTCVS